MTSFTDLSALNKSSAKVATFAVKIVGAKASEYTFTSKRDNKQVTAHKFEAEVQALCPGVIGSTIEVYGKMRTEMLPTPSKSHYT